MNAAGNPVGRTRCRVSGFPAAPAVRWSDPLQGVRMSDTVPSLTWICPGCQRLYKSKPGRPNPELCASCRKISGASGGDSSAFEDLVTAVTAGEPDHPPRNVFRPVVPEERRAPKPSVLPDADYSVTPAPTLYEPTPLEIENAPAGPRSRPLPPAVEDAVAEYQKRHPLDSSARTRWSFLKTCIIASGVLTCASLAMTFFSWQTVVGTMTIAFLVAIFTVLQSIHARLGEIAELLRRGRSDDS